jgi:hypothetical protein
MLDREEYIEQAYFFRVFRERLEENLPAQEILGAVHEEILTTTRLPMAIQFLAAELKHTGLISSGFAKLPHYFNKYQAFVVKQSEEERRKFSAQAAFLVLEREALYRANNPTRPGLFVYQFETISRNRLGYDDGIRAMQEDPFFDTAWQAYLETIRMQVGIIEFAELVYLRSEHYVRDQERRLPGYQPPVLPLFGEKEGRIAKASRGRDPLFLFAALQRQLGYPEVPRPRRKDDSESKLETLTAKFRELIARVNLLESEARGKVDLSQFKPDFVKQMQNEED